jgi:uncharacterized delta-60 repeat protein
LKRVSSSFLALSIAAGNAGAVEPAVLLDRGFGQEGIVLLRAPYSLSRLSIRAVRIVADGAIFIGGAHGGNFVIEPYVLKLDEDGHVEPTFGTNGLFSLPLDVETYPGATMGDIALLSDGRIAFVAGLLEDNLFLTRTTSLIGLLTQDGQLDTGWAATGYRRFDFVESIYGLTFGHRGVLAVDGSNHVHLSNGSGTGTNGIARFRTDGTLDPVYGTNGVAWLPEGVTLERIRLDAAGRLWGAGPAVSATLPARLASMRLLPNGQLDASYEGGLILSDVASTLHEAVVPGSLAFDREERPIVGFAVQDWEAIQFGTLDIARYTTAGGLDQNFNADQQHGSMPGIARIALGGSERPYVYAEPLADGGVLAIGHIGWIRTGVTISRLHADGASDPTLPNASDGYPPTLPLLGQGSEDVVMATETDAAGHVVMAGVTHDGTRPCLFVLRLIGDRLFADGQDPSDRPTSCPTP